MTSSVHRPSITSICPSFALSLLPTLLLHLCLLLSFCSSPYLFALIYELQFLPFFCHHLFLLYSCVFLQYHSIQIYVLSGARSDRLYSNYSTARLVSHSKNDKNPNGKINYILALLMIVLLVLHEKTNLKVLHVTNVPLRENCLALWRLGSAHTGEIYLWWYVFLSSKSI